MDDALTEEGDAWKSAALEVIRCLSLFQSNRRRFKVLFAANHKNRNSICLNSEVYALPSTLAQSH
jgi:hypothetical protein